MKRLVSLVLLASTMSGMAESQHPSLAVVPTYGGQPVRFDDLAYTNDHGQALSVTRLDFLMSGFALQRPDGTWLDLPDRYACIRARDGRTAFDLPDLPGGTYAALRFHVGLPPSVNNADPSSYPPDHPLNPNVNGLHWSWLGGYVFLAIEGLWRGDGNPERGYSFHIASDRQLMTVSVPLAMELPGKARISLNLDVQHILGDVALEPDRDSTHSRENDELASTLKASIEKAFSVAAIAAGPDGPSAGPVAPTEARGTPYRFTFPRAFPMPQLPLDNPLTEEGVALGRRLFHEPLLSINGEQRCATCHKDQSAFNDPEVRFSLGAEGLPGVRNTMPLFNLAWKSSYFWDGRAPSLREQVKTPIENPVEMHETMTNVARKLAATETYPALFEAAFGSRDVTPARIGLAVEQFLLTQLSFDSKFDRALAGQAEFTEQEKRGFALFSTEYDPYHGQFGADCFHCHGGPLFSNSGFANNGLDDRFADKGRMVVTGLPGDEGKFAVPSLRNVAVTAPYMHDGRFATLEEVVDHYNSGVKRSATLDPNIAKHPDEGLNLSSEDKQAIAAFLKTLTDARFTPDARSASLQKPAP